MTKKDKINWLQRYILVHSWIYYENNDSLINDRQYDLKAAELVKLQRSTDITTTQYGYVFYDFDGTTGFDLFHRLKPHDKQYIVQIAHHVIKLYNIERKENE